MNTNLPDLPSSLKCYWVLPGQFLAGEYPASRYFEQKTQQILDGLLNLGVDTFIDLTRAGELPPYDSLLQLTAGWQEKRADYLRFPIADFDIPSEDEMRSLLAMIDERLQSGRSIYMHCYAGIGRTGTVVGCFLAERSGSGEAALTQLAALRSRLPNARMRSPESDAQCDMVRSWKKAA